MKRAFSESGLGQVVSVPFKKRSFADKVSILQMQLGAAEKTMGEPEREMRSTTASSDAQIVMTDDDEIHGADMQSTGGPAV